MSMEINVLSELYRLAFLGIESGLTVDEAWQLAAESIGPEALALVVT